MRLASVIAVIVHHPVMVWASATSDIVSACSLFVLACVLGLPSLNTVGGTFLRKRQEIALIFALASASRLTHFLDLVIVHDLIRIVQGVVSALTAAMALIRLYRALRHVR